MHHLKRQRLLCAASKSCPGHVPSFCLQEKRRSADLNSLQALRKPKSYL